MTTTREDRIKGVLLGQAAGDALGANYEFGPPVPADTVSWDKTGSWQRGEYTDDTEQALVVALARGDAPAVARGLMGWYAEHPKDVGLLTRRVLGSAKTPADVLWNSMREGRYGAQHPGADKGSANGSLMRTGPVALPFLGDRRAVAENARLVSDVTHYTPDGVTADITALWSLLISDAVEQGDKFDLTGSIRDALDTLAQTGTTGERMGYLIKVILDAYSKDPTGARNGGVVGAFRAALHANRYGSDFQAVVTNAVSYGRDTDTVAAIAGALAGARFGASSIPSDWLADLHGWSPGGVTMTAKELGEVALAAAGIEPEQDSAPSDLDSGQDLTP